MNLRILISSFRLQLRAFAICFLLPSLALGQKMMETDFVAWSVSPEMRVTPASLSRDLRTKAEAEAFRNEFVSMQFAVRSPKRLEPFSANCLEAQPEKGRVLQCSWVEIRYPGYLLVDEVGQYTSDPLFVEPPRSLEPNWTQAVWLTVHVPKTAEAGSYVGNLKVGAGDREANFTISLRVLGSSLPDPPDWSFYLNIWQDPAAVARWAKVPLWSEEHWKLLEAYARDLAAHGQKSITTTILHDPWQSQTGNPYAPMVEWRFPGEWKLGEESRFQFDYTAFDRYVELMTKAGVAKTIHAFSMVNGPGDTADCNIGYVDTTIGVLRVRHTSVGDEWYRRAWAVFLPAFVRHLKSRGWLDRTYIGFDEKPQRIMNRVLATLHAHAPALKIALAGGSSGERSLTAGDLTIHWDDLARPDVVSGLLARRAKVGPTVFYTACTPYTPNTFMYSPLWESRMLPWIAWRYGLAGYLRWAYQSWPDNLWQQPLFHWHSGDNFLVYPGESGPISSTRWEMLRQGIQDFEVLRMSKSSIAELRKNPARAHDARRLEKSLRETVESGTERDDCARMPDLHRARERINRLLAEARGLPMEELSSYTSNIVIQSNFSPQGFVPDGNLDKPVWQQAERVRFDNDWSGRQHFPEAETEVASFWTSTHVYFAFWSKYSTLNTYEGEDPAKERWELWNRDVVEVFLNPRPERVNHYYEFEVAPGNQWIDLEIDLDKTPFNDAGWDSHFEHATRLDREKGIWTCEMRIPVNPMNVRVMVPNREWRVNFYRADGPGDDSVRRFLSWSPVLGDNANFHVPTRFGIIRFVK